MNYEHKTLIPRDYDGDDEAVSWMALPLEAASPEQRRGAEVALLVAEEMLAGLPKPLRLRFMTPYDRSLFDLYSEVLGSPPATFLNVKGTGGTYFSSRADELWVSLREHPLEVAKYTLHEAGHAWLRARGAAGADEEDECDAIAERLLPFVVGVADQEGGLRG